MDPDHLKRIHNRVRENISNLKEDKMWGDIRRMALTDPGMADLIERVIVYYLLKKEKK